MIGVTTCNDYFYRLLLRQSVRRSAMETRPHRRCRGVVALQRVIRMDRSVSLWYSFSWAGSMFARAPSPKSARAVVICTFCRPADRHKIVRRHHFDPTWPQHWPDLGSSSASKAPTSALLGPIGSNFGPTWLQDGATWPQLGPILEQLRPKLRSIWLQNGDIHSRPNPKSSKSPFHWYIITGIFHVFAINDASFEAIFPMLCLRWAQLGVNWLYWPALHGLTCHCISSFPKQQHWAGIPISSIVGWPEKEVNSIDILRRMISFMCRPMSWQHYNPTWSRCVVTIQPMTSGFGLVAPNDTEAECARNVPAKIYTLSWSAPYSASLFAYSLMDLKSSEALRSGHVINFMNLSWSKPTKKRRSVCQQVCSKKWNCGRETWTDSSRCFLSENVFRTMQLYGCLGWIESPESPGRYN